jgi:hypothetical protein
VRSTALTLCTLLLLPHPGLPLPQPSTEHSDLLSWPLHHRLEWRVNQEKSRVVTRLFLCGGVSFQTEKLEPQPQVVVALGFLITNCEPVRSSL